MNLLITVAWVWLDSDERWLEMSTIAQFFYSMNRTFQTTAVASWLQWHLLESPHTYLFALVMYFIYGAVVIRPLVRHVMPSLCSGDLLLWPIQEVNESPSINSSEN